MQGDENNNQEYVFDLDVVPAEDDEYDESPELDNAADSSDGESYAPDEDDDDGDDSPDELEDVVDEDDVSDDDKAPRRSSRARVERDLFVPNQQSYMNVGVSEGQCISVMCPKMFHPTAISTFGVSVPDFAKAK